MILGNVFLSVFLMKFMDCSLSTLKTVFLCKNKFFISSILNSLAAALFIFVADAMANAPSDQKIFIAIVVFLANLTGGYFPPKLLDKAQADKLFVYVITSKTFEKGTNLADQFRELNLPVATTIAYNSDLEKVIVCKVYCNTRKESKIVDTLLTSDYKYHIIETN